jgi:hypothetical protein
MLIENAPLPGYPVPVEVTLTGGFERGSISVAGATIELGPRGRGARRVFLSPPEIEVRVQAVAAWPARFAFAVTINGRTVTGRGAVGGDGKARIARAYPFAAFGLDPAAPPEERGTRRRGRGRPRAAQRERPRWLPALGHSGPAPRP